MLPVVLVIDDAVKEGSELITELGQLLIEGHAHKLDEPDLHTGQLLLLPPIHHCLHKTIHVRRDMPHCLHKTIDVHARDMPTYMLVSG